MICLGDDSLVNLTHKPLRENDVPSQLILGQSAYDDLITKLTCSKSSVNQRCSSPVREAHKDDAVGCWDEALPSVASEDFATTCKEIRKESNQEFKSKLSEEDKFIELKMQMKELARKKVTLSEMDTTGSIILTMIDIMTNITDLLDAKNQKAIQTDYVVPEIDKTYTCKAKVNYLLFDLCLD